MQAPGRRDPTLYTWHAAASSALRSHARFSTCRSLQQRTPHRQASATSAATAQQGPVQPSFEVDLEPCPPFGLDVPFGAARIDLRAREDELWAVQTDVQQSQTFGFLLQAAARAQRDLLPDAALACLDNVLQCGYDAAREPSPQLAWVHQWRARHLAERGDLRGALEASKEELRIRNGMPRVQSGIPEDMLAQMPAEIREDLRARGASGAGGHGFTPQVPAIQHVRAANRVAVLHYRLGQLDDAFAAVELAQEKCIALSDGNDINDQHTQEIRAMVLFDKGDKDEAIERIQHARDIALPPGYFLCCPSVYFTMLLRAGRRNDAMDALQWAHERMGWVQGGPRYERQVANLLRCARQL